MRRKLIGSLSAAVIGVLMSIPNILPASELSQDVKRGTAYYRMGKYEAAIDDFIKSIEKRPDYNYPRIYLLASAKRVSDEMWRKFIVEQKEYIQNKPSKEWSITLLRYASGDDGMKEDDVLAEAGKAPMAKEANGRLCEAWYVFGEVSLWKGDEKKAMEYFTRSVETGETGYIEYGNAKALLQREHGGTL